MTLSSDRQLLNANSPTESTLSGIVTLLSTRLPLNAFSPIAETGRPSYSAGMARTVSSASDPLTVQNFSSCCLRHSMPLAIAS